MKRVIVKNLAGVQTHGAEIDAPVAWIAECLAQNAWGKPERLVPEAEAHDPADVLAVEQVEVKPAVPAVLDELGNVVEPEVPAVIVPHVRLRAEYTVEVQDVTAEHELAEVLAKRKAEYPSPEEFLNAYFDGGDEAVQQLKQARLAVKAKYPKPGV